ncbi:amino acid ABC transporter permease [Alkaliphilus oremlandii]|uniref:Polar amino acid ABC transporter, inner membrane subunit n=1 Tax=Alkaliphilus oremlandii (strain OhILAs) TaxID=350688 RepID=A8MJZ2_ALKOO|nr:amino acid ABC transporter permease [Alkaliphilus oremlandii]ABW20124.1 polar amino acid ABC transporter, inner membrane subunit [Alkaliphilus oremlandii OhILAs]
MTYIYRILPAIASGMFATIEIFIVTLCLSIPLGLVVALGRLSTVKIINRVIQFYILIMRGTPLLLQLVFVFFGLPYVGITLDRKTAALLALTLNYAAYFAEIFRGGIDSINQGQYEAAMVLGFSKYRTIQRIILPQVFKVVLPSVGNEVITLVKDTSLVYVVGLGELLRAGKIAANRDASLLPLVAVGMVYLILISILTEVFKGLERKYSYYR